MDVDRKELADKAKLLKQRDKLKVFNIIMKAWEEDKDLNDTISQTLLWCERLCDLKK